MSNENVVGVLDKGLFAIDLMYTMPLKPNCSNLLCRGFIYQVIIYSDRYSRVEVYYAAGLTNTAELMHSVVVCLPKGSFDWH